MNNIDIIAKILNFELSDIKNMVKYTRTDTFFMEDIPSFKCYNDDTYIEFVFDHYSLTLGGYMSISHPDGRIQDDVKELLYSSSINDFHTSELFKRLEDKFCS